jgi:hypothetical protein
MKNKPFKIALVGGFLLTVVLSVFGQTANVNTASQTYVRNYVSTYANTNYTKPNNSNIRTNTIVGVNADNTALEFKLLQQGTGVSITYPSAGIVRFDLTGSIANTGTPAQYNIPMYLDTSGVSVGPSSLAVQSGDTLLAPNALINTLVVTNNTLMQGNLEVQGTLTVGGGSGTITSGTFTPTLNVISGAVTGTTAYVNYYTRIGDIIQVAGQIDFVTSSSTDAVIEMTLPVASALVNEHELSGVGTPTTSGSANIFAGTVNNTARFTATVSSATTYTYRFVYSYRVI